MGQDLKGKFNCFSPTNKAMLLGIDEVLAVPGVNLHLYGKEKVRPGRKMGHISALADSVSEAIQWAEKAKSFLCWG